MATIAESSIRLKPEIPLRRHRWLVIRHGWFVAIVAIIVFVVEGVNAQFFKGNIVFLSKFVKFRNAVHDFTGYGATSIFRQPFGLKMQWMMLRLWHANIYGKWCLSAAKITWNGKFFHVVSIPLLQICNHTISACTKQEPWLLILIVIVNKLVCNFIHDHDIPISRNILNVQCLYHLYYGVV